MIAQLLSLFAAGAPTSMPSPSGSAKTDDHFLRDWALTRGFTHGSPREVQPTPDGKSVLFLRSGPRDPVLQLYEFVVATGEIRVLATPDAILKGSAEQLSDAEKARRERMRVTARGFSTYRLSRDGERILLSLSGKLYVLDRKTDKLRVVYGGETPVSDPTFSPDASKVAYVKGFDVYVTEVATGKEHPVTNGGTEEATHGVADFVAQEEMSRYWGYWWSPDGKFIAYEEADNRGVERFAISDPAKPERGAQTFFYPRPGKANAKFRLGIVPVSGGKTVWAKLDTAKYPYLARVLWEEEKAPLSVLVQSRDQREESFLSIDRKSGATATLHVERDDAWLDLEFDGAYRGSGAPPLPKWLPDGSGFLFASDRSGRTELELYRRNGELARVVFPGTWGFLEPVYLARNSHEVVARCATSPVSVQLVRASIDAGEPVALTHDAGEHEAEFSRDGSIYVDVHYDLRTPRRYDVIRADGTVAGTLPSVAEDPPFETRLSLTTVDGARTYYASLIRPREFDSAKKYPVVLAVYGGPGYSVVHPNPRQLLEQWIADHGAVVVAVDNRGTPRRDRAWERAIRGSFGTIPLEDQVDALKALAQRYPELDLDRVGVYGWSFGGYLSALAVLKRPDVFKVGVAGAPVSEWRDYDTHYTERYLGTPEENAKGYDESSLLTYADKLERPLLIIHGTNDDNVYFFHSLKLADALFKAGKSFEFLPLQGFTHMVPDPLVQERLYGRIVDFLFDHLGPDAPKSPR
jgi:dipeptidyl-peptidase 4